ncbi:hypothetical protein TRP8649_01128 [Pelagimonas phthalicica]|uniref:Uncharacterized protein n=1 Tax=Pelagimonas phthalicica TaxID=1037362 RepID=A0A238JAZ3_9RHOB|nr:hypothetical protein [Pelagimonas phthalicica]TDS94445.1 hypothetical protein CLV87_0944 [Pelagimonas phthalicica]SMX27026.1 hypothetical protein TRP8649_01128 [Pelagimonas phthalicica]
MQDVSPQTSMLSIWAWNAALLGCILVMVLIGWNFGDLAPGLMAKGADGPIYCRELKSSGADDDALIFAFTLFSVPGALRLARLHRKPNGVERLVLVACILSVCVALYLVPLDCGEIVFSTVHSGYWLAFAQLALALSIPAFIGLSRAWAWWEFRIAPQALSHEDLGN